MAKRVKRTPSLPNVTADVRGSVSQLNRVLYQDGVEQNYRLNLAFPKDGTEPFEAPMPLQSVVTGSLPNPTLFEGNIIYDTTTNTLKYSNGVAWVSLAAPALTVGQQTFTASGTYTPTAGMQYCKIRVQAPGGGSGGADGVGAVGEGTQSAGGGGGEYAEGFFSAATIGANQTVTIGAVGTAGNATGGNGGTGGTSSVGSLITCIGGGGGTGTGSNDTTPDTYAGGDGGTGGTGGHLRIPGGRGRNAWYFTDEATFSFGLPGSGGWSFLSCGTDFNQGLGDEGPDPGVVAGQNYGAGGAGRYVNSTTGVAGAAGGPSIIIIEEFILT